MTIPQPRTCLYTTTSVGYAKPNDSLGEVIELYDRLPDLEAYELALPLLAGYSIAFDRLNSFKFHRYRKG
jgi:hypothetical protein